jgi:single-strand DNA-binding protein
MATKGVNKVTLLGRIGTDPDLRKTPNGKSVIGFRLGTSETWKDQQGQQQEITDWHSVVVWGGRAEVVSMYAVKGDQIYIEGKNRTRQFTDSAGVERWVTEVIVDQSGDVQLIGNKPAQPK